MIGEAAALTAAACWAVGSHLFARIGRDGEVPAGSMNLGKCATATLLFGITVAATTGRLLPPAPSWALGVLAASGFVGLTLGDTAYFGAIVTLGVRRALLLLSTAPVFTAIGGAALGEELTLQDGAAIAAVMAGVALVVQERAVLVVQLPLPVSSGASGAAASRASREALGIGLGLSAGAGQAAGSLMSRRAMAAGISAMDASFLRIVAGLAGIVLVAALAGRLRAWTSPLRSPRRLGAVAASATIGTYAGIWLAQFAIGHAASTAIATTLLATSPIFALPLGRWLEGERITGRALAGTLVAFAGLASLTLARR